MASPALAAVAPPGVPGQLLSIAGAACVGGGAQEGLREAAGLQGAALLRTAAAASCALFLLGLAGGRGGGESGSDTLALRSRVADALRFKARS